MEHTLYQCLNRYFKRRKKRQFAFKNFKMFMDNGEMQNIFAFVLHNYGWVLFRKIIGLNFYLGGHSVLVEISLILTRLTFLWLCTISIEDGCSIQTEVHCNKISDLKVVFFLYMSLRIKKQQFGFPTRFAANQVYCSH